MSASGSDIAQRKAALRTPLIAARRARSAVDRTVARERIAAHLLAELGGPADRVEGRRTIAGYLALATEPLAPAVLHSLAARYRVLLPVVTGAGPLDWSEHQPSAPTATGRAGISEPTGVRLGPAEIAEVDLVLVPALAVDRRGYRLGRGGGHYDRTLALAHRLGARPRLIAVVHDDEWVDEVPYDDLDIPVDAVVTPSRGVVELR